MALLFNANNEDLVFTGAPLEDIDPVTYMFWCKATATAERVLWCMDDASSFPFRKLLQAYELDVNRIQFTVNQATDDLEYRTVDVLTPGDWTFIAVSYDSGATPRVHIYHGNLTTLATEPSYAVSTDGSGSPVTTAGFDFVIGNITIFSGVLPWDDDIAIVHVEAAALSLGQVQSWQFRPRVLANTKLFVHLGFNGTSSQPDWSGNVSNGTVASGVTIADHVPLGPMFSFDIQEHLIAVAAETKTLIVSLDSVLARRRIVAYTAHNGAEFDGTNDYLTRGADLTGNVDGKQGIFSCHLKITSSGPSVFIFSNEAASVQVQLSSSNKISFFMQDSAASTLVDMDTVNTYTAADGWIHILASWDTSITTARHLFINRNSDISALSNVDGTIDYTKTDYAIGALVDGTSKIPACIQELYFNSAEFLDFSDPTNVDKFVDSDGNPINLGSDGSLPTGNQPIVYQKDPFDDFEINSGSGGNFTENGALTDCGSSPSDDVKSQLVIDSALQTEFTRITNIDSAIQKALTTITDLNAAIQVVRTTESNLNAIISATRTITAAIDSAVQKEITIEAFIDSTIQKELSLTSELDSVVEKEFSITALLDSIIQKKLSITAILDSAIQKKLTQETSIDGAIQQAKTILSQLDAGIQSSKTDEISLNALIQISQVITFAFDAVIQAQRTLSASLNAAVQDTLTLTVELNAGIQDSFTLTSFLDSSIQKSQDIITELSSAIQKTITVSSLIDSAVQDTVVRTTEIDGIIAVLQTRSSNLDSIIQVVRTIVSNMDSAIQDSKLITSSLDSAVQESKTLTSNLDSRIVLANSIITNLNAIIQKTRIISSDLSSAIQDTKITTAQINAGIAVSQQVTISIDSILQIIRTRSLDLDSAILNNLILTAAFSAQIDPAIPIASPAIGRIFEARARQVCQVDPSNRIHVSETRDQITITRGDKTYIVPKNNRVN